MRDFRRELGEKNTKLPPPTSYRNQPSELAHINKERCSASFGALANKKKMNYSPTIISIIENIILMLPALLVVAYVTVAERKTMASMQRRLGPNAVGLKPV